MWTIQTSARSFNSSVPPHVDEAAEHWPRTLICAASVWLTEESPHSHLGNDSHSPRVWHHSKEREMRRRKMKVGGGLSLALQNLCGIPADAPTFSFCQEDRRKRKKIIPSIPAQSENKEWEEPGERDSDAPSRCQQVRGSETEWGKWRGVCEPKTTRAFEEPVSI